jgi:hypothetical protein
MDILIRNNIMPSMQFVSVGVSAIADRQSTKNFLILESDTGKEL